MSNPRWIKVENDNCLCNYYRRGAAGWPDPLVTGFFIKKSGSDSQTVTVGNTSLVCCVRKDPSVLIVQLSQLSGIDFNDKKVRPCDWHEAFGDRIAFSNIRDPKTFQSILDTISQSCPFDVSMKEELQVLSDRIFPPALSAHVSQSLFAKNDSIQAQPASTEEQPRQTISPSQ